ELLQSGTLAVFVVRQLQLLEKIERSIDGGLVDNRALLRIVSLTEVALCQRVTDAVPFGRVQKRGIRLQPCFAGGLNELRAIFFDGRDLRDGEHEEIPCQPLAVFRLWGFLRDQVVARFVGLCWLANLSECSAELGLT